MAFENKIMKEFLENSLSLSYNFYDFLIDVIVVDSANFDESLKGKKWVDKDFKIATFILDKCKKSIFDSNIESSNEYTSHFQIIKKSLIDVKFDEEKNLLLGAEALLAKDRKDFILKKANSEEINVSFHSLPLSILKLWDYEEKKKPEITCASSIKHFAEKSDLILSLVICRDNGEGLISFFIHNESKLLKRQVEEFCNGFNSDKCEGKAKIYEEHGVLHFRNKDNISRKIVFPALEKYLSTI